MSRQLVLRSYLEWDGATHTFYAHCIDLCLDAEASSAAEARARLDDAIIDYLQWAFAHTASLDDVRRPSPRSFRLRYWIIRGRAMLASIVDRFQKGDRGGGSKTGRRTNSVEERIVPAPGAA